MSGFDTLAVSGKEVTGKASGISFEDPVYCVGSVSKVYVTAAVMKLVDEGKMELDGPVTDYIPDFTMADERYKKITVRMLMDHTSGIMGTSQNGAFLYDDNNTYNHDTLLEVLSKQRLKADPGEYAAYCNDGFGLLELIVENVSGMSYTDYVISEVAGPTGGKRTGTGYNYTHGEDLVPAYTPNNLLYDNESCMALGAGGVYSTAEDVAKFGTSFFKGNGSLLTEDSKEKMSERWDDGSDEFKDESGLGWDYVSMKRYEDKGVNVLGKGGDVLLNHGFLMVAPDEEISIAVLSNGGSSTYNGMLAEAIMDTVLEEAGVVVEDDVREYKAADTVPSEYDDLAGYYAAQNALAGGAVICKVSFPDHGYMHVENISPVNTTVTDYIYTTDGKFAELAYEVEDIDTDAKIAANPGVLTFVRDGDNVYIAADSIQTAPGLGSHERKTYIGEKMKDNPVSDDTLKSWENLCGMNMLLCNDLASSANYQYGMIRLFMCEEVRGFVFIVTGQGTRLLKIDDKENASAFQTIPSSSNRDIIDLSIAKGKDGTRLVTSAGPEYISEDNIPEYAGGADVNRSEDRASWYRIGDGIANSTVSIEKPENGAIYVYNKYGDNVYNTHVKDASSDVPMPKGGYIVFTN